MEEKKDDEISIDARKSKILEKQSFSESPKNFDFHEISGIAENANEEFSIDFSRIKRFFKKKFGSSEPKAEPGLNVSPQQQIPKSGGNKDEISFDFSKIKESAKNFFKKDKTPSQGSDGEFNLDIKKIYDFSVKHMVIILLIIPIFLSIFVRIQPAYLSVTDDWAS